MPACSHENRSFCKEVEIVRREGDRLPIKQRRGRARRSGINTSEEEIAAGAGTVAQVNVEGQRAKAVARTQGSRMRVLGRPGSNDLFEDAGTARSTRAEKFT